MPYGMYLSAEGAWAQAARLEIIANNLANVDTPGFKKDLAVFQARYAEAIEQGLDSPGSGSVNDTGGGINIDSVVTDFSPGPLKQTGIPTDIAIDGDGFFVVIKDDQQMLTRAGDFRLGTDGRLLTQEGHPVQSADGGPVQIDVHLPWHVTDNGHVSQAGTVTPLALVMPASLGDLVKVGQKLFAPLAPVTPLEEGSRRVRSGFLETSGVKPTQEMMELIQTTRAFEANVALIQNQDEMLENLINRVLGGS